MSSVREITPEEYLSDPVVITPSETKIASIKANVMQNRDNLGNVVIRCLIGLVLIWIGAVNAGSAFATATHMTGILATFFYTYQGGTILIVSGIVLIYDTIKKAV